MRHAMVSKKGWGKVAKGLVDYLAEEYGDVITKQVTEWGIQAVQELSGSDSNDDATYRLADGTPMLPYDVVGDGTGNIPMGERSTLLLVDSLRMVEETYPGSGGGNQQTRAVMDELLKRNAEIDTILTAIESKTQSIKESINGQDVALAATPRGQLCGWAEGIELDRIRKRLSKAGRANIRLCLGSNQDGKRVSREPHEYRYCKTSGQIDEAITLVYANYNGTPLELADFDRAAVKDDFSFGMFVDMPSLRKFIARIRKVRRLLKSANVKRAFTDAGVDSAALETTLLNQLPVDAVASELNDVLRLGN